ncbi:MAG: transglutaminase domain-containing protein [Fimbriimonadaceae bacterium]|nr:transglutaminase domain-containing protein [Fimbriimonadaceae bacterium]
MTRRNFLELAASTVGSSFLPVLAYGSQDGDWQSWVDQGWKAYDKAKDYKRAEECFLNARRLGTLRSWEYWALRKSIAHQERYEEALSIGKESFEVHRDGRSLLNRAESFFDVGDGSSARKDLAWLSSVELPNSERKELLDSWEFKRMAVRDTEVIVTLSAASLEGPGRSRFEKLGYFECYIPAETPYQTAKLTAASAARSEECFDDAKNRFLKVWPKGDEPAVVKMLVTTKPLVYRAKPATFASLVVPAEDAWLLKSTWGIDVNSEVVKAIATENKRSDVLETVRAIKAWWHSNVTHYDTIPPAEAEARNKRVRSQMRPGQPQSDFPLLGGCTRCGGITEAMCAVFRAAGVPARSVMGLHRPQKVAGWHTWTEILLPQVGWVPVDDGLPFGEYYQLVRLCQSARSRKDEDANSAIFYGMQPNIETRDVRFYV